MRTHLHFFKNLLSKQPRFMGVFVLILMLLGVAGSSQAQVYYLTNDGVGTSASVNDAFHRMGYDGSSVTDLGSAFTTSPTLMQLDLPNNRAFVYEAFSSTPPTGLSIKVVNLSNNTVTTTIPITITGRVQSIKYDPVNDYIYYVIQDAAPTTTSSTNDALVRVKPDGTGYTVLAAGFCSNPSFLALDIAHSRVFIYQNLFADHSFKILTLSNNTASVTSSIPTVAAAGGFLGIDCDYDAVTDYIYFLTSDNVSGTASANDALNKIHPDGTGQVVVKASVAKNPLYEMALDAGNNRAFVFDNASGDRAIYSVNLSDGTTSKITSVQTLPSNGVVTGLFVPARALLTTTAASNISSGTVTVGGNITRSDVNVTERGVVYSSTSSTPTTNDGKQSNGTGTGSFSVNLSGLNPVVTYYARAYAISAAGTSYGSAVSFTTLSNDATLSGLSLSAGTLNPAFAASTIAYTATVGNANATITVTPTKNNSNASIKVNGTAVNSGTASGNIDLNLGDNSVTVLVTAQDGTTKTYTVTVTRPKFAQTITFAALPSKTYGNADFAPGATANSWLGVSYSSDNANVATIVNGNIHIVAAGTANIIASQAGNADNLAATDVSQSLTVGKVAVTVTATTASKVYGDSDPSFTYGITTGSLITGDVFSGTLNRTAGVDVGAYAITQGSLALSSNYTLTFVSANLNISKRPLNIKPNPASKVYGDADPVAYPYNFTAGSLASGDGMTGSFTREAGDTPGTYALSLGTKHPANTTSGADVSNNYQITFTPEYLTIGKRAITLQPDPATKVYGSADPVFPYRFIIGSVAPGEGMTGTFARTAGEDVGSYALSLGTKRPVNISTGAATGDYYTISFIPDNLTITKRTVNVTANAQSKAYSDADPTFTYAADALSFTDAFSGLLSRAVGESVGAYAINQGTLALNTNNYSLNFTGANLAIGKKTINVTANAQSKIYGDTDAALTYTADALASGDSFAGTLSRDAGEGVGTYAVNQGSLALNGNYTLSYTGANFTIGKRDIALSANYINKLYGESDPALTYSITSGSLASGDAFTGSLTREAGETPATYAITQGTLLINNNYNIAFTGNSFHIDTRYISVTANPQSKYYGDPDPELTYTVNYGSLLPGDHFTGALTRAAGEAGTQNYAITQGTLAIDNPNYSLAVNPSNFVIAQAELTVKVDNKTKKQGEANPEFTFTYSGFKNGEGPADLVSLPQANTTAGTTSPAGDYTIYAGYVASPNYSATYVDGVLTILPVSHDATLSNITIAGLSLSPTFDSATTFYEADAGDANSVTITPTVNEAHATITINGEAATSGVAKTYDIYGGTNYLQVNVTAEDGTTSNYYQVLVSKNRAVNANLASLSIGGTAVAGFDPNVTTYALSVPNTTASVTVGAVLSDPRGMVTLNVNGTQVEGGAESPVNLVEGSNIVKIRVRAENPSFTKTYTVTINRAEKTNDASLTSLVLSPVTVLVNSGSVAGVTTFTTSVDPTASSLSLTATAKYALSTIRVNGVVTASGSLSAPIALPGAQTTITVGVTAPNGTSTRTYKIIVNKNGSNDALVGLVIDANATLVSNGTVDNTTTYNTSVAADIESVRLTAKGRDANVTIKINNVAVGNGVKSDAIALNASGITPITVVATAQDGVTVRTYIVNVSRNGSNNVNLSSVKFSAPATSVLTSSDKELVKYTVTVASGVSSITLQPTLQDPNATLYVNGSPQASGAVSYPIDLFSDRPTPVNVYVAAQDGVTGKLYIYSFVRSDAQNTTLTLKLDPASTLVKTGTTGNEITYSTTVSENVNSVTVTPTAAITGTVIKVNGNIVNSGSASAPIALNSTGTTSIAVVITAADGVTTKTNTIIVSKTGSGNVTATFKLNASSVLTLSSISGSVYNYISSVDSTITGVRVTPTAQDANAHISINGVAVANNTASDIINLNTSGTTLITAVVTAENGVTTRTFKINVNRIGSNDAAVGLTIDANAILVSNGTVGNTSTYNTSVAADIASVRLTAKSRDANVTIKINDVVVGSGVQSDAIPLNASGITPITVVATAQDGVTVRNYIVNVSRNGSNNANGSLRFTPTVTLTTVSNTATLIAYSATVANTVASVKAIAGATNTNSVITVNGAVVSSGVASAAIPLAVGSNMVTVVITAQDGVTTKTYTTTITREFGISPLAARNVVDAVAETPVALVVHPAISPNGDGLNDVLTIDGITSYPENKLSIINSTGNAVNEIKNYDNSVNVFDGRSRNGTLQKPGTYFYVLEYQDGKETKRKTGYIILKY